MRGQRSIAAVHISHLIQPFGWCASFMREIIFDVLTDNYDKTSPQKRFDRSFFELFTICDHSIILRDHKSLNWGVKFASNSVQIVLETEGGS